MAKHRRMRGLGTMIRVRRLRGLGDLRNPNTTMGAALPATIGAGVVALVTIGLRYLMKPTTEMQMKAMEFAPYIGMGTGLATAIALGYTVSRSAGVSSASAAVGTGSAMLLAEYAAGQRLREVAAGEAVDAMRPYGMGAIVPEYGTRGAPAHGPHGAIVMEPYASRPVGNAGPVGNYGDVVNLSGINSDAFGSKAFTVSGRR
jgi:hypothetical protein